MIVPPTFQRQYSIRVNSYMQSVWHISTVSSWHVMSTICACSVTQLCLTFCDPMDCSTPGSSVNGILQARILGGGLPFSLPQDLPDPGIKLASPVSPALAGVFFTTEPPGRSPVSTLQTQPLLLKGMAVDVCSLIIH